MYKLLNASFTRLKKNSVFWLLIIATILISIGALIGQYKGLLLSKKYDVPMKTTEELMISFLTVIGFFIATFTSIFVGAEYSNGTIRNKIVIGNSRMKIYLSNLIISIVVGIIIEFIYLMLIAIIAIPLFQEIQLPVSLLFFIAIDIIMIIVAYSSLFNCIAMLCSDVIVSTIFSIILTLILLISLQIISFESNTILNIIPTRQATLMPYLLKNINVENNNIDVNIEMLSLYSSSFVLLVNSIGIYYFNKKDLK